MEFILANSELFIILGVVLIFVLFALVVKPLLQRHGYIKKESLNDAQMILFISRLIVSEMNFTDEKVKQRTALIMETLELAMAHIKGLLETNDKERLIELSYQSTLKSLGQFDIEIDKHEEELIKGAINFALKDMKVK